MREPDVREVGVAATAELSDAVIKIIVIQAAGSDTGYLSEA
jgi:hypothetical protein